MIFQFASQKFLRELNLLSDNNEIVCTLREFNDYRRDLHRALREKQRDAERLKLIDEVDERRIEIARKVENKVEKESEKYHRVYGVCTCSETTLSENAVKSCQCRYEKLKFVDELDVKIIRTSQEEEMLVKSQHNHCDSSATAHGDVRRNSIKNPCKYENNVDYILKRKRELEDEKRSK